MRMLNEDSDESIQNLLVMLTRREAEQTISYLQELLSGDPGDHAHLESIPDFQMEITFGLIDEAAVNVYSERIRKLITEGS